MYFLYRKGSGIRRNGEFVDAACIEKVIAEVPAVDDVYVYGIASANGVSGEKDVVAAVVPKNPDLDGFDVQGLFRLCRQQLEPNAVPSRIQLLDQIPKTASEKPQDRFRSKPPFQSSRRARRSADHHRRVLRSKQCPGRVIVTAQQLYRQARGRVAGNRQIPFLWSQRDSSITRWDVRERLETNAGSWMRDRRCRQQVDKCCRCSSSAAW
jgi:hypothetical protein